MPKAALDERRIWEYAQNNPELVVQDAVAEFGLDTAQAQRLREILRDRGVNKWLLARRRFIRLKHRVKNRLKRTRPKTPEYRLLQEINADMQRIAKAPRWVEWPAEIHRKIAKCEAKIIERGQPC